MPFPVNISREESIMNCPVCKTEAPPVVGKPFHSLTDVHGHYVFGVDDGPSSLEMSMKMIRSAWQQGVWAIVCTSHSWGTWKSTNAISRS